MKTKIHAGRILLIFLAALLANNTYPLVAGFLAMAGVVITFVSIDKQVKQERKNK
jgi:hypothetical protein